MDDCVSYLRSRGIGQLIQNDCKHDSKENNKAIYDYLSAAASFAQLQQNGIKACIEEIFT